MMNRLRNVAAIAVLGLASAAGDAFAQPYPNKPVSLVVGFAPGGSADILARVVAQKLSTTLGQQVIVENKPGAGATIAAAAVAAARPDGHTLLLVTSGHAGSGALYAKLPYDPIRSFAPIAKIGATPVVIVAKAESPYRSLRDVVAAARKRPGDVSYGAGGGGATVTALAAEYLKSDAAIDLLSVPYKGSGPALNALLGGEIDLAFDIPISALPHLKSGRMRALAVSTRARTTVLPDVPTVAEQGLPNFEVLGWFGVMAPSATPVAIVERLNREIIAILKQPDVNERLASLGIEPGGGSPVDFGNLIATDTARAVATIQRLGIKLE